MYIYETTQQSSSFPLLTKKKKKKKKKSKTYKQEPHQNEGNQWDCMIIDDEMDKFTCLSPQRRKYMTSLKLKVNQNSSDDGNESLGAYRQIYAIGSSN